MNYLEDIVILEKFFSHDLRHRVTKDTRVFIAALCILLLVGYLFNFLPRLIPLAPALLLISIGFFIIITMVEAFYRSIVFDLPIGALHSARVRAGAPDQDLLLAWCKSDFGREVLVRTGLSYEEIQQFVATRGQAAHRVIPTISPADARDIRSIISIIYKADAAFSSFLGGLGLSERDLIGALEWVLRRQERFLKQERWWARQELARIPGLAKDWAYGVIWTLEKYSREIPLPPAPALAFVYERDLSTLQRVLLRDREANALLVGPSILECRELASVFAQEIAAGSVHPALEHYHIRVLNTDLLLSSSRERTVVEERLIAIVHEGIAAGNIILVIEDMPQFLSLADKMGINAVAVLDQALASSAMHMIATASLSSVHAEIDSRPGLGRRFEKIIIDPIDEEELHFVLEGMAENLERKYGVTVSYGALREAATYAERLAGDESREDKAIDFLIEAIPHARSLDKKIVGKDDVIAVVQTKTQMPVGVVTKEERENLLGLEEALNASVVGQSEAMELVAHTIERARAGTRNTSKPIGSFLFLGPTGVGKTETAKALARIYFKNDDALVRLDMSEYRGTDAVDKLIGSFKSGAEGVLARKLRENPYCVLLLDEFEKTTSEVFNLFLSIIDEGVFTDGAGAKVNARNTIIIATSNAASTDIFAALSKGAKLSDEKDAIVQSLISQGIFSPELMNRFDAVVLYNPLSKEHMKAVAKLLIAKLAARLHEQGITLTTTDEHAARIAELGSSNVFGARPMARAIQEKIELPLAEEIIRGNVKPGSTYAPKL